jgi:hypothetical protein
MKISVALVSLTLLLAACNSSEKAIANNSNSTPSIAAASPKEQVKQVATDTSLVVTSSKVVKVVLQTTEVVEENTSEEKQEVSPGVIEVFNHSVWDGMLKEFVSEDGKVDYRGFSNNKGELRDYIASLGANMPTETWTQEDNLAYWMNAYNAMTVDLILRNLPIESIKDIEKPWDQRLWKLGEKWYNLDEIEHQILRKMGDPRIHFGINCASFSCPPLLNEAFTSQNVNVLLDQLARKFVNDPKRNTISENSIQLSKIFSWFAQDFKTKGTLIDFLNTYSEKTINPKAKKSFKTYDWTLNN